MLGKGDGISIFDDTQIMLLLVLAFVTVLKLLLISAHTGPALYIGVKSCIFNSY